MKKSDAPSRINALSVVKLEVEPSGVSEELTVTASVALMNERAGPGLLGRSLHKGPWPADIRQLITQLRDRVEEHLLSVYFEVNEDDRPRKASGKGGKPPAGIIEPELGRSATDTPQL